jgi:diguanylate cyclase
MSRTVGRGALLVSTAAVTASVAMLVAGTADAAGVAGPVALLAAFLTMHRLGAAVSMPPPLREFWRTLSHSAVLLLLASVVTMLLSPATVGTSPYLAVLMAGGTLLAMAAFLRLKAAPRTPSGWVRALLDGVTVTAAAALFFAYVAQKLVPADFSVSGRATAGTLGVSMMLTFMVITRVATVPRGPAETPAARLLALVPVLVVVVAVVLIAVSERTQVWLTVLAMPLIGLSFCAAALRQHEVLARSAVRYEPRPTRGVLPLLAVAVTTALVLIVSARDLGGGERVVIIGAALIATLVVARQMLGLRENRQLLDGLRAQQAELERVAMTDRLTGLPNRTRFSSALAERLAAHRPATVLLIDVDDFKTINDTMGPALGDQLLFEVGQRLRTTAGPDGLAARLGGDEFALLLDVEEVASAEQAAADVLRDLAEPFRVGEQYLLAHASLGVAIAGSGDTADEVLRNADIAMYAAKEGGKAAWTRFEPRMRQEVVNHARLGSELRNAIIRGELYLLYQPVFDIVTGRPHGAEALVRWNHPVRGLVPPGDFIPVAERSGLIVPLGSWVLREACAQLARWRREHGAGAIEAINVNVAVRQLREPCFVDEVAAVLSANGLLPGNLVLEVTESSVADGRQVRDTLHALHEMGVRLALDDFGTGQSSLSLLRAFPVDVLKLDKSFVDGIADGEDRGRLAVAAAVAQLAEYLHLGAVAEGIETEAQLIRLRDMGYRLGQGFYMAKPLPPDEAGALMRAPAIRAHAA